MVNREKQADVLRRTQAKRKEQKKEQVLKAIQELLKQKKPLTFKNIATVSGCSISYLYKWDDIKAYIHELQNQKSTTLNSLEEPEGKERPHSLKTLHQVAKDRIRKLEEEIRQLKHQNEILRGHVAEIYEIKDENERLRTQLRELISPDLSSKIIPIRSSQASKVNLEEMKLAEIVKDKKAVSDTKSSVDTSEKATSKKGIKAKKTSSNTKQATKDIQPEIINSFKEMGLKVTKKLREEIDNRDLEQVKLSIEAFKQYRDNHEVKSQEACLLSMICDEAEPNTESKPIISKPQQKVVTAADKPQKELVSLDKLKQLSSLFSQDHD
ncbi:MAG: hypothetical protein KME09_06970 [Pleurocapsa minor HA4230-MV1]|jgi:hypothetical protein|nr:hypothetical protein [Pleurocapsa minor HA4230-MV1]